MILRDPVHGLVAFEGDEEGIVERLLDTPEVQRLRRVRQLGVTSLAFPGAEHSRFAHAIGAAFVMKLFLARLRAIHGELPLSQQVTATTRGRRSPRRSCTTSVTGRSRTCSRTPSPERRRTRRGRSASFSTDRPA